MAPKPDTSDPRVQKLLEQFASISFTGQKAAETLQNAKTSSALSALIERLDLGSKGLDAKQGTLVTAAASSGPNTLDLDRRAYVVERILDGSLTTPDRVSVACKYLSGVESVGAVDKAKFDEECGVGVTVSQEQVKQVLEEVISSSQAIYDEQTWAAQGKLMTSARADSRLRWAHQLDIKNSAEQLLEMRYGPKGKVTPRPPKQAKDAKQNRAEAAPVMVGPDAMFKEGFLSKLHKPGGNPQCKPELREQHLKATGGRVFTRFPPEPNGFLHIGHSKAIAIDFGYAKYHGGLCYLRYDDTNPAAEEEQYFDSILEMVRWLGFEPFKITYSSDYFDQLYNLAVELIKRDKAYVDHSTAEEIYLGRGGKERGPRYPSKYRSRPVEESLKDFEDMKNGKYKQGSITLRMKQDLVESGNPQMWDMIAYRVLDAKHHRTGDKWCIYPTYDFTHCLVDSFENISHSLCTTEFVLSRESYEWLCDALEVYKPRQYEFGRLNLEGTITSKRKILKLVKEGYVQDWDDPRLHTLLAMRRRGVPPGAILSFVNQLGVTTTLTTIESQKLDQTIRQYVETSTPRLMMLLHPVKVVLENVPDDFLIDVERPLHPKEPSMGTTKVPFTKHLYIDAADFREDDDPAYYRLAPNKPVGLLNTPYPVTCTSFTKDAGGRVSQILCRYEDPSLGGDKDAQPKAWIQWVAEHKPSDSPVMIDEVRLFKPLFTSANPAGEDNFLDHVDRDSLERVSGSMIEPGFWEVAKGLVEQAKKEAEARTVALEQAPPKAAQGLPPTTEPKREKSHQDESAAGGSGITGDPNEVIAVQKDSAGAPDRTTKQLYGNEVVRFQGMRIAYFAVDNRDSILGLGADATSAKGDRKIVLNRIVSLKEDAGKKATTPAVKK